MLVGGHGLGRGTGGAGVGEIRLERGDFGRKGAGVLLLQREKVLRLGENAFELGGVRFAGGELASGGPQIGVKRADLRRERGILVVRTGEVGCQFIGAGCSLGELPVDELLGLADPDVKHG